MKKNIFSNRSKTEYKRMMARYLIVMLLGLPIVANLSEYTFADDLVAFEPGVEYAEDVQDADVDVTEYEVPDEADTEVFELAGVEDVGEVISESEVYNDIDEEPALGIYEDKIPNANTFNGWNTYYKYTKLHYGDKVTAVPGFISYYTDDETPKLVKDLELAGGYDRENHCWYGVAGIPDIDTSVGRFDVKAYTEMGGSKAIVRIDNVDQIEPLKEYEATYLYDSHLYFDHEERTCPRTVQYKNGRIYVMTDWVISPLDNYTWELGKYMSRDIQLNVLRNSCTLTLLYSTDVSGNDIKLHYRFADVEYGKTIRCPWYIAEDYEPNRIIGIEDGVKYEYRNQGIVWHDNKWQAAFIQQIPGVYGETADTSRSPIFIKLIYKAIPNGIISEEDIGGYLSGSDYWFNKCNTFWSDNWSEDKRKEAIKYLLQWLCDNGFIESVYLTRFPTSDDLYLYRVAWHPEYLEELGVPKLIIGHENVTDADITYLYEDGTLKKGGEVVGPGKKDDSSGDITEDDIPAPKTIEYNLGPVVVKNQLDIRQLVSSNSAVKMKYKVDNKKIAKVNSKGIMTGKNAGYVTVTGYAKVRNSSNKKKWVWKETGSVKVEVTRPSFKGLDGGVLTIKFKGDTLNLNDYIANDSTMTPTFSVNRSGMAKVSNDGTIEATGEGKAKVTIIFGKYKMKLKVIVIP